MPHCAVIWCTNQSKNVNKQNSGVSYHKFPNDPYIKDKWILAVGKYNWFPQKHDTICSDHFEAGSFAKRSSKTCLSSDAIPTLKLHPIFNQAVGESDIELSEEEEHDAGNDDNTSEKVAGVCDADNSNIEANRKREHTESGVKCTKKEGENVVVVKVDYDNIDKFAEQIAFLLKRIPRKLCRKVQNSIISLVKIATKNYQSKTKRDAVPSTSSGSSSTKPSETPISRPVLSPTLGQYTKHKKSKQQIPEEAVPIDSIPDVVMKECAVDETTQATQNIEAQLGTSTDQRFTSRIQTISTFPKPMTVPIELVGSLDCVKQEVLDPGESSDSTAEEQYIEATTTEINLSDYFVTDIKIEIEESDLAEAAKIRSESTD